jgi:hypothetical protein
MQEVHSFEYAIIRVVPKVEREEFLNVGVILYCASKKFLKALIGLNEDRLTAMCAKADIAEIKRHLAALGEISNGTALSSPIGKLDNASRFRWLTAARSTVVQCSKVHPGMCSDPEETLKKLFNEMVL